MLSKTAFLAITAFLAGAQANACPPTGRTLPPSQAPRDSPVVKETIQKIKESLTAFTSTPDLNATAIAIGIKTVQEDSPLFEFYHTPAVAEASSAKEVTIDTVFRGGSITKLFTVLAALQSADIQFTDPVTKYLPGLKKDVVKAEAGASFNPIPWDNITIEDLASHVSGVGGDIATDLAVFTQGKGALGLPDVANETRPTCSGFGTTSPCTTDDLIAAVNKKPPVFRPHTTPIYSNIGIALLGAIVEAATNKSLEDALQESILKPLGLTNTSISGPESDAWGFIPKGELTWGGSLGVFAGAGGIYTNTRDMLSFGTAVLSNNLKIDSNSWLKPRGFTISPGYAIGAPWEIFTSTTILPSGLPLRIYTKTGDLGSYSNVLLLVPDHDVTISILTAGPAADKLFFPTKVISPVVAALIPALEAANKEAAAANLVGTYADPSTNSTLTLALDDEPGLSLQDLVVRNVDVLPNLPNYSTSPSEKTYNVTARLYPTNVKDGESWSWRAVYKNHDDDEIRDDVFYPEGSCPWGFTDRTTYDYLALDDFVLTVGEDGAAKSISPRPFGVTLNRVEPCA
ncbi:hypothetical protein CPLU01_04869 [Colletotrichum plurivorum]|uniref:Beta-lactamase-related domain-containing protein n=1 Tax=Colletotrichum plurivorum TaxID=2175906 RepID=A0A8H6KN33_9PEZI|nr:hypothetical protein CPLU01_04869 [Colletotrichum plurivorum]